MKECLKIAIKNIKRLEKIPLKRFPWSIEMVFLTFNCEIDEFIRKYEKYQKNLQKNTK